MKKTYEKPSVAIEYYELSQAIAACETKIGLLDSQCVLADPDATAGAKTLAQNWGYFSAGACQLDAAGMENGDGICYHTSANAMFSS